MVGLALVLAASVPVSACAMLAGLPAECQPDPHCAEMASADPDVVIAAGATPQPCCQIAAAPTAESRQGKAPEKNAARTEMAVKPALVLFATREKAALLPISGSPPSQSLLCVFLI